MKFITTTSTVLIVLLFVAVITVSGGVVLAGGIGIGWLLTWLFPTYFNLFQGSVLGFLTILIVSLGWTNMLRNTPSMSANDYDLDYDDLDYDDDDDDDDYDDDDYDEIPITRFYQDPKEKTWEAWFRYQIANSIYIEFQDSPKAVGPMGDRQVQELAVRLADIAVALCKRKSPNTKKFQVTQSSIKKEMNKMGQRPYGDDILELAVSAVNEELSYEEDLQQIIRNKAWDDLSDMFD
ncbi:hypothetical protein QUF58_07705 [Anaerolineales bacterium HSG24]|nr:hypothetical protein [Anaerolineales bacterium HSG24]